MSWVSIPLNIGMMLNVDDPTLRAEYGAIENAYINDSKGLSRFPGLVEEYTLPTGGDVYLHEFNGDMMAATSRGSVYRIGKGGTIEDVTEVIIQGGRRVIADTTEDEIVFAAGGRAVRYAGKKTELLSADAPEKSSHFAFISGYAILNELESGRWYHSSVGQYRDWSPLDVFTAESKSDNLTAIIVTPRNELLMAGNKSIERWEPFASGDQPFFRRGSSPEGIKAPYTLISTETGNFGINQTAEFVQFLDQYSSEVSDRVQQGLSAITNWNGAWCADLRFGGEQWIIIQAPEATNDYGTKGVTLVYDERKQSFYYLYGWDSELSLPAMWPGRSHLNIWDRNYIGGMDGKIYTLNRSVHENAGQLQRFRLLTAHYDETGGQIEVKGLRLRMRRGALDVNSSLVPKVRIRVNRDNRGFGPWIAKDIGIAGQRNMMLEYGPMGIADTFQFEVQVTDAVPVDIVKLEVDRVILDF